MKTSGMQKAPGVRSKKKEKGYTAGISYHLCCLSARQLQSRRSNGPFGR